MKKPTSLLLLTLLVLQACAPAYAATQRVIDGKLVDGLQAFTDQATNGGAERAKAGWVVSGTSSAVANLAVDTTNKYEGNAGFAWTPANADNYVTNTALTLTANQGLSGQNCAATVYTKTSVSTHALEVYDGTNVLATVAIPISTTFTPVTLNWVCSASGTNQVRFNAGGTTVVYFDSLHWGDARGINLTQTSQATLVGTISVSGCAETNWSTTSTSFADPAAMTTCSYTTTGAALQPATAIPAIKFASLPPGEYSLEYEGSLQINTAAVVGYFQFSDGTNTARESSLVYNSAGVGIAPGMKQSITYTTGQSNVTLAIKMKVSAAGTVILGGNGGVIRVYRFPSATEQAYSASTSAASWSGYHDTTCSWARTNAAYGDPATDASCALVERSNRNFGTVTSVGGLLPGIIFTPTRAGRYRVCASAIAQVSTTIGTLASLKLVDGLGSTIGETTIAPPAAGAQVQAMLCGILDATSTGSTQANIQSKQDSGGSVTISSTQLTSAVEWTIFPLDQAFPAPVLVGSVTSSSAGAERIERVLVATSCTSTPCTIASQSGSWVSSIARGSLGNFTLNIVSGIFSGAPACTVTPAAVSAVMANTDSATTTSVALGIRDHAGNAADSGFSIQCMGPR